MVTLTMTLTDPNRVFKVTAFLKSIISKMSWAIVECPVFLTRRVFSDWDTEHVERIHQLTDK